MKAGVAKKRILDVVLYTAVGVCVVALALGYAIHSAQTGGEGRLPLRWVGLAGATAITFGYPLRWYRKYWRHGSFWMALFALLGVHLLAYTVILLTVHEWPLIAFAIITPFEWLVICPVVDWAGRKRGSWGNAVD